MKQIMNEQLLISTTNPLKARFFDYQHFTYPWHFHLEYEIMYIKESSGVWFVGNTMYKFRAGDVMLFGSNVPHYTKSDDIYHQGDSTLRAKGSIIQFEKDLMHYSITHYPHFAKIKKLLEEATQGIFFSACASPKLLSLLEDIPQQAGLEQMMSLLQLLKEMSNTEKRHILAAPDNVNESFGDMSRINKVISFLNKNYTRNVELQEVASVAAMNPSAFCRFFKGKTSKSLKTYILDMRINYACKLLIMEDLSISHISAECGFDTISHFNKTFKSITGHTPTQYREIMI